MILSRRYIISFIFLSYFFSIWWHSADELAVDLGRDIGLASYWPGIHLIVTCRLIWFILTIISIRWPINSAALVSVPIQGFSILSFIISAIFRPNPTSSRLDTLKLVKKVTLFLFCKFRLLHLLLNRWSLLIAISIVLERVLFRNNAPLDGLISVGGWRRPSFLSNHSTNRWRISIWIFMNNPTIAHNCSLSLLFRFNNTMLSSSY